MKFKVGDMVVAIGGPNWLMGQEGEVVAIEKDIPAGKEWPYVVEFPHKQRWQFSARELEAV